MILNEQPILITTMAILVKTLGVKTKKKKTKNDVMMLVIIIVLKMILITAIW